MLYFKFIKVASLKNLGSIFMGTVPSTYSVKAGSFKISVMVLLLSLNGGPVNNSQSSYVSKILGQSVFHFQYEILVLTVKIPFQEYFAMVQDFVA